MRKTVPLATVPEVDGAVKVAGDYRVAISRESERRSRANSSSEAEGQYLKWFAPDMNCQMAEPCSFFDCLNTTLLEVLKVIMHFLELVGGVTLPIRNLADDANWIPRTV